MRVFRIKKFANFQEAAIRRFSSLKLVKQDFNCMAVIEIHNLIPNMDYILELSYGIQYSMYISELKTVKIRTKPSPPNDARIHILPGSIFQISPAAECRAYWEVTASRKNVFLKRYAGNGIKFIYCRIHFR